MSEAKRLALMAVGVFSACSMTHVAQAQGDYTKQEPTD
jgi:hypothetical protein